MDGRHKNFRQANRGGRGGAKRRGPLHRRPHLAPTDPEAELEPSSRFPRPKWSSKNRTESESESDADSEDQQQQDAKGKPQPKLSDHQRQDGIYLGKAPDTSTALLHDQEGKPSSGNPHAASDGAAGQRTTNDEEGEEEEEEQPLYPESEPDPEAEAEMAELRARSLKAKPFANAQVPKYDESDDSQSDRRSRERNKAPERIARPSAGKAGLKVDSDAESGSDVGDSSGNGDDDDDEFDRIINATTVTDRTGITAKERAKKMKQRQQEENGSMTFRFSRATIDARKNWPS